DVAAALLIEVQIGNRHRIVELDGQVLAVTHSIVVDADALAGAVDLLVRTERKRTGIIRESRTKSRVQRNRIERRRSRRQTVDLERVSAVRIDVQDVISRTGI